MVRSLSILELLAILALCLIASTMMFNGSLPGSLVSAMVLIALGMVLWITLRDVRDFVVPDIAVIGLAAAGLAARFATSLSWSDALLFVLIDTASCGGMFLLVREAFFRLRGYDGMGFGDVKLAAACGIVVGVEGFAWSVFAASALGLLFATGWTVLRPERRIERLPFGALLAPACWSFWVIRLSGAA